MSGAQTAGGDPSMEDILASIRRILSEEEPQAAVPANDPAPPAGPAVTAPAEDVLILDSSMLVAEGTVAAPEPAPPPPPQPMPVVVPPPVAPQPESPVMSASMPAYESLASVETAAAASGAVSGLLRVLASDQSARISAAGPPVADLVREELRPLLKAWLDANLPPMVERLVKAEIDRVIAQATR